MAHRFRFAIGITIPLSEVWTLFCNRNDVYLSNNAHRGMLKASLHASGVCQYAMLPDYFESREYTRT